MDNCNRGGGGVGGGVPPLIVDQFVKKRQIQSVTKFLADNFLRIFETLSALGDCKVTFIEGVVYTKAMIFEYFENISAIFQYFFMKYFLISRSY